jgi:hypothetical protein
MPPSSTQQQAKQPERDVSAIYDGEVLRPATPLDLPPGSRVRLRIRPDGQVEPKDAARPEGLVAAGTLAGGLVLALLAQQAVAGDETLPGTLALLIAAVAVAAGVRLPHRAAWLAAPPARLIAFAWRVGLTVAALVAGALAFANADGNRYRPENVLPWLLAVGCFLAAWLDYRRFDALPGPGEFGAILRRWLTRDRLAALALLLAILTLGAWFRFAALADNPREMNSDQAEKLLDVGDLLAGTHYIFFERNTGREPWQFYWTAALIRVFDLQPDFMALKLGTALIGWLMLPAIFLLARELIGTRGALIATLFAAVASWGVITARFGLRYPLAPCAVAWTLAFLVRGLRRDSRNSMLAVGVWIGIGLQGYTAYRFMLVVVPLLVLGWLAWLLAHGEAAAARRALVHATLAAIVAVLAMLPLLRYGIEQPDQLFYRAATRLTGTEQAIAGDPALIFLDNLKNVLLMFNYTADEVWVANLPDRPAMDPLLGALLVVGAAGSLALSWRTRNPWPAFLLGAGLLMLVPSALSIAFPGENPSVVRTGGALPALMVVCAVGPAALLAQLQALGRPWLYLGALACTVGLALLIVGVNQRRVFVDYPAQYCPRAQNASDIARELLDWEARGNSRRDAWIVGYPHWVDSRAVGVWIGEISFPNTVMGPEGVAAVDLGGRPGWFGLNRDDLPSLQTLYAAYPGGQERRIEGSGCAGRDFIVFETQPGA